MMDWLRRTAAEPRMLLAGREVPVVIKRHPTARRMTLRLAPDGSEVRLTLPRWGRTAEGLDFAASRRDWLEEQAAKVPEAAPPRPSLIVKVDVSLVTFPWTGTRNVVSDLHADGGRRTVESHR